MKILLTNYRYFISGGPERYLFNVQARLAQQGHTVIPFSVDYARNQATPLSRYFVSPIGSRDQVYFDQHGKSPVVVLKTLSRLFYSQEVEQAVVRVVDEQQPDVAYILHYLRKLSPSLLVGLKKRNIPIVVRLSDYAMLCPQAHCLREGEPCTLCARGDLWPSIRNKCLKGSLPATLLNAMATWFHRQRKYFDLIDIFVCTNKFMHRMMVEAGYPENRLVCIPTCTELDLFSPVTSYNKGDYIVYCGRVTPLKGVHVLLEAYALLQEKGYGSVRLKIAGTGEPDYLELCLRIVKENNLDAQVDFVGEVATGELPQLLSGARFSVVPSLWFENLPNSLLESMACGTPVVASDIGSLSSCINEGKNGFLFSPGNAKDLSGKMILCLEDEELLNRMAKNARLESVERFGPARHLDTLVNVFQGLLPKS